MKPFLSTPNCLFGLFVSFLKILRIPAGFFIILASMMLSGCFRQFYSTNTANHIDSATLLRLIDGQKYFIMHDLTLNKEYALNNVKLSNENLTAETGILLSEHTWNEHPASSDLNVFPRKNKHAVLYEVHLYSQNPGKDSLHVIIPLKDFSRVDVYELDKKSTTRSTVGSIIGFAGAAVGVVAVIVSTSAADNTSNKSFISFRTF